MKPFAGFKSEDRKRTAPLPAGTYVAKIIAARVDGVEPDQSLVLALDVAEGEYTGYFMKRYEEETERGGKYEVKYKGSLRLRIPNANNTKAMYPESDLRTFNSAIYRIEASNPGYKWDWNESGLTGKIVGICVQESEYNGFPFTKIKELAVADDVRKGLVKTPEPQLPKGDAYEPPVVVDQQTGFQQVDTEELPF